MVEVRQHVESDVASRVCLILSSFLRSLALSLPFQLRSSKVAEDFTSLEVEEEEEAAEMVEMKREKSFSQLMPSRSGSRSVGRCHCIFIFPLVTKVHMEEPPSQPQPPRRPLAAASTTTTTVGHAPTTTTLLLPPPPPATTLLLPLSLVSR